MEFEQKEGIRLEEGEMEQNAGMRALSKLCLNRIKIGEKGYNPDYLAIEYPLEARVIVTGCGEGTCETEHYLPAPISPTTTDEGINVVSGGFTPPPTPLSMPPPPPPANLDEAAVGLAAVSVDDASPSPITRELSQRVVSDLAAKVPKEPNNSNNNGDHKNRGARSRVGARDRNAARGNPSPSLLPPSASKEGASTLEGAHLKLTVVQNQLVELAQPDEEPPVQYVRRGKKMSVKNRLVLQRHHLEKTIKAAQEVYNE
ncbi:hypothetical protein RvY_02008 [Ramazzottius varieornatus]|uniref:Uncharacterized protein n=1 Tax=Ramazzottius varieornatus TaxID=947166 RepID=A0A1D1UIB3_RAMVA|nr:hypothetical protein RvY_02008 [Ramazzottius varieornatus]